MIVDDEDDNRTRGFRGTLRVLTAPEMLAVLVLAFVFGTMQTMLRPLLAPYAVTLGAGPFLAGWVVAAQQLPGLMLAVPAGSLTERMGDRWVLGVGGGAIIAGAVLAGAVRSLPALLIGMFLMGIGTLGVALTAQGVATAPVGRGALDTRRVAVFGTFVHVGQLVGPTLGGVLADHRGYQSAFWAAVLLGAALPVAGLLLRRARAPEHGGRPKASPSAGDGAADDPEPGLYRRAFGLARGSVVAAALGLSALGILLQMLRTAFLPLHLNGIGWSASAIGLVLSGAAATALVGRVVFPVIERRVPPRALFTTTLVGGACALAVAVATESTPVIAVSVAAAGGLLSVINPSSLTLLARQVAEQQRRLIISLRITANRLAQTVGPVFFGALVGLTGLRAGFVAAAAGISIAGGLAARRVPKRQR